MSLARRSFTSRCLRGVASQRPSSAERGFATLEVVIGAVLVGISVVGLSLMLSNAGTLVGAQGDQYIALYLAQQKTEEAIAAGFAAVVCGTTTDTVVTGESGTQTFTRVKTVTCSGGPPPTTKEISVTVTPSMRAADPATLVTVLTKH